MYIVNFKINMSDYFSPVVATGTSTSCDPTVSFLDAYNNTDLSQSFNAMGVMINYADLNLTSLATLLVPNQDMVNQTIAWTNSGGNQWMMSPPLFGNVSDMWYEWNTNYTVWICTDTSWWSGDCDASMYFISRAFLQLPYTPSAQIFMFNTLPLAQQWTATNYPITSYTAVASPYNPSNATSAGLIPGNTYYYTYDVSNLVVIAGGFSNAYVNSSPGATYTEYKTNFDDAINNCNQAMQTYNTYSASNLLNSSNASTYLNAINAIRANNGLYIPGTSPGPAPVLYAVGETPTNPPACYITPVQAPWFNPNIYGTNAQQLNMAAQNCNNLTTIMQNEAVNCCANDNAQTTTAFGSCPDIKPTISSIYGCNSGAQVPTDGMSPIITGSPQQSFTAANYAVMEGFSTIGEDIAALHAASNAQGQIAESTLNTIASPSVQSAYKSISNLNNIASSGAYIKTNLNLTADNLYGYAKYTDANSTVANVRRDVNTSYNSAVQSINDCSIPTSIIGVDASGNNYLANGGTGCAQYQSAYENALSSCQNGLALATQFNDTNGQQELTQLKSNISIGTIGRTMADAQSVISAVNTVCGNWVNMYDEWSADEVRAAAVPCQQSRPISNNFDNEISSIVNRWNTEATNYIQALKLRLDTIYAYVQQYPNKFNINVINVPNGTPNAPFVNLQQPANTVSTAPVNYTMNMYLPAGPIGLSGPRGSIGAIGATGPAGKPGSTGAPGIAEVPIQYTSAT